MKYAKLETKSLKHTIAIEIELHQLWSPPKRWIPVETAVEMRSWGVELEAIYKFCLRFPVTSWMLMTGASWKWPCWKGTEKTEERNWCFSKSGQKTVVSLDSCGWQGLFKSSQWICWYMDTLDPKHWIFQWIVKVNKLPFKIKNRMFTHC